MAGRISSLTVQMTRRVVDIQANGMTVNIAKIADLTYSKEI